MIIPFILYYISVIIYILYKNSGTMGKRTVACFLWDLNVVMVSDCWLCEGREVLGVQLKSLAPIGLRCETRMGRRPDKSERRERQGLYSWRRLEDKWGLGCRVLCKWAEERQGASVVGWEWGWCGRMIWCGLWFGQSTSLWFEACRANWWGAQRE